MRIAASSWCFHRQLYAGEMRLPDVPHAVYECGLRHVELNDAFLTAPPPGALARLFGARPEPSQAPDYGRKALKRLRDGRLRSGARLVCWSIDTDLTPAGPEDRRRQRAYLGTAIEAARFLGAPILRATLGGRPGDRDAVGRAIDLLRGVLPVAMATRVQLAIENHGGLSSQPGVIEEVVGALGARGGGDPRPIGACLDLGHFEDGDRPAGVERLAPLAVHVHAPARAFDERGEETEIDYGQALGALRAAGYDGAISVEYMGEGDPRDGIRTTKALIDRHWSAG